MSRIPPRCPCADPGTLRGSVRGLRAPGRVHPPPDHRKPGGMGGSKDPAAHSPANLLRVCGDGIRGCHGMIESNRTASYGNGRLVRQGDSSTDVPVLLRNRWTGLTEFGQYVCPETGNIIQSAGSTDYTEVPW